MEDLTLDDNLISEGNEELLIRIETDPNLLIPVPRLENHTELELEGLISSMIRTCKIYNILGASANQFQGIDSDKSVLVYLDQKTNQFTHMINPEIVAVSEKLQYQKESSLNHPYLQLSVYRPQTITVKYQTKEDTTTHTEVFYEKNAIILSQLIQTLDGLFFGSNVSASELRRGKSKRLMNEKRYKKRMEDFINEMRADEKINLA